jgi:hypothetical protein
MQVLLGFFEPVIAAILNFNILKTEKKMSFWLNYCDFASRLLVDLLS